MKRPMFTDEELAEMAAFDAQVDDERITQEEIEQSRRRDKEALYSGKDKKAQKIAENQRAYYSKPENREARRAYMREYMRMYNRRKKNGKDQNPADAGGAEHAE